MVEKFDTYRQTTAARHFGRNSHSDTLWGADGALSSTATINTGFGSARLRSRTSNGNYAGRRMIDM
jgi:hypothetical protein